MSSTVGMRLRMTIYGESHGPSIGIVLDGLPPNITIDLGAIEKEMARRVPGQSPLSTHRKETDQFTIESGFFEGKTTGMALCARIVNHDAHSKDYSLLKDVMRPSHGDYPGYVKSHGANDYRGGGAFSGRLTAPLVFAGAVAKQLLRQKESSSVLMWPALVRPAIGRSIRWEKLTKRCCTLAIITLPPWMIRCVRSWKASSVPPRRTRIPLAASSNVWLSIFPWGSGNPISIL